MNGESSTTTTRGASADVERRSVDLLIDGVAPGPGINPRP
jgi:hypothetical protein